MWGINVDRQRAYAVVYSAVFDSVGKLAEKWGNKFGSDKETSLVFQSFGYLDGSIRKILNLRKVEGDDKIAWKNKIIEAW
jgi:hypothetical protein